MNTRNYVIGIDADDTANKTNRTFELGRDSITAVEPAIVFHTSAESATYYELTGGTPNLPVVSPRLMAVIESLATKGIRPNDLSQEFIDYAKALAVIH